MDVDNGVASTLYASVLPYCLRKHHRQGHSVVSNNTAERRSHIRSKLTGCVAGAKEQAHPSTANSSIRRSITLH
jgi:hypothetical protein